VTILIRNSNGFTLIEMMVAIVIMMVGLLGLLESINVATEYNLRNQLRDEAVYAGEKYLNELRGRGFDNIAPVSPATSVTFPVISTASKIRGSSKKMRIETTSTSLASDTLQLLVVVNWTYKGVTYENRVTVPFSKVL
jgi:type IV pilus assembly protein PilV